MALLWTKTGLKITLAYLLLICKKKNIKNDKKNILVGFYDFYNLLSVVDNHCDVV